MSNVLAVAAVTSTIRYLLERALSDSQPGPIGGARVTTSRPDAVSLSDNGGADVSKGINVYLYNVTPNHAWNLTDLPTRRADGSLAERPTTAIDLHYLISFYGDDGELDQHRLLGRTVLALATNPVLTRDLVADAMAEYGDDTATSFLTDADLGDQVELVKLAPSPLSLEELSKLWGVLGTPYLLSLTYSATVVLLEADVVATSAPPVQEPLIDVSPMP